MVFLHGKNRKLPIWCYAFIFIWPFLPLKNMLFCLKHIYCRHLTLKTSWRIELDTVHAKKAVVFISGKASRIPRGPGSGKFSSLVDRVLTMLWPAGRLRSGGQLLMYPKISKVAMLINKKWRWLRSCCGCHRISHPRLAGSTSQSVAACCSCHTSTWLMTRRLEAQWFLVVFFF
jgi:hypothetical protein